MPPRKPQGQMEGETLRPQPSSPRYPHRTEDRAQPRLPHSDQDPPSAAMGEGEQCLLGTFAEDAIEWKDGPLWEGHGLGCVGACGSARRLLTQCHQLCSAVTLPSTHMLTYMHIYGQMVTQRRSRDHTNQGQDKKSEGTPTPSLWVSVASLSGSPWEHKCSAHGGRGRKTHAELHWPAWVGPQPPRSAGLRKGATLAQLR